HRSNTKAGFQEKCQMRTFAPAAPEKALRLEEEWPKLVLGSGHLARGARGAKAAERWLSGLKRTPGKREWAYTPPGVRISLSPPFNQKRAHENYPSICLCHFYSRSVHALGKHFYPQCSRRTAGQLALAKSGADS